ncbi:hypothetical protein BBAD15_g10962 [Beauveria bassiana D1-5]|uniref:Uncharacterized protein n=2 Tax=Beauveria bassiana TaxID=176275 RepID=A0A0A2V7E8_BEABA|nr:hypothetical protein BBAD15_g10962 [Beauveria bassiana D1-5]
MDDRTATSSNLGATSILAINGKRANSTWAFEFFSQPYPLSYKVSSYKLIEREYAKRYANMSSQTSQGISHATGNSKVPQSAQEKVPKDVEQSLPDSVHPTSSGPGQSTNKSHAKNGGDASIVPQKLQEKLPESVERAVPNVIHDTGDK